MTPTNRTKGNLDGVLGRLVASVLTKEVPAYVQFYVTARCNLICKQCNIIFANADQEEASMDDCRRIAENLAKIGTSVVLLTGGEPFIRKDIVEIVQAMVDNGLHVRLQTNGLARPEQLEAIAKIGACDISISLDSVLPSLQDEINGGFNRSWERAIEKIALINQIFPRNGFAALGCVVSPMNFRQVPAVIQFATQIGWWVSLVPAHTTPTDFPRQFCTFDKKLQFPPGLLPEVHAILQEAKGLRNSGCNLYDSDEFLDDIFRYISGEEVQWRRRNGGRCDSPNLYFAIQPNGDMAVCCDFRLSRSLPVQNPEFPTMYRDIQVRKEIDEVTLKCPGCLYGSFPEISISSRFFVPMFRRARLFLRDGNSRSLLQVPCSEMKEIAYGIARDYSLI